MAEVAAMQGFNQMEEQDKFATINTGQNLDIPFFDFSFKWSYYMIL